MAGDKKTEIHARPKQLYDYGKNVTKSGDDFGTKSREVVGQDVGGGPLAVAAGQIGANALFAELVTFGQEVVQEVAVLAAYLADASSGVLSLGNTASESGVLYETADNDSEKALDKVDESLVKGWTGPDRSTEKTSSLVDFEPALEKYRRVREQRKSREYPRQVVGTGETTNWDALGIEEIFAKVKSANADPVNEVKHQWFEVAGALLIVQTEISYLGRDLAQAWPGGVAGEEYREETDLALKSFETWEDAIRQRASTYVDVANAITSAKNQITDLERAYNDWIRQAMAASDYTSEAAARYGAEQAFIGYTVKAATALSEALTTATTWDSPESYTGMLRPAFVSAWSDVKDPRIPRHPGNVTQPTTNGGRPNVNAPNQKRPDVNDPTRNPMMKRETVPITQNQPPTPTTQPPAPTPNTPPPATNETPTTPPPSVPPPTSPDPSLPDPTLPNPSLPDPTRPDLNLPDPSRADQYTPPPFTPWSPAAWTPGGGGSGGSLGGRVGGGGRDVPVAAAAPGSGTLLGRGAFEPRGNDLDPTLVSGEAEAAAGPGSGMPMMPPMMPPALGGGGGGGGGGGPRPVRRGGPRLVQPEGGDGGKAISGRGADPRRAKPKIVDLDTEDWTTTTRPEEEPTTTQRPEQRRVHGA